jgi:hypothetical protein
MAGFRFLTRHRLRFPAFEAAIRRHELDNVFNPSWIVHGDFDLIAFRARRSTHRKSGFKSFLFTSDRVNDVVRLACLTDLFSTMIDGPVADPKLFLAENEVWCTFNTGFSLTGNGVFLVKVFPEIGIPARCEYPLATTVEKNWAFFRRNNSWHCIYSLQPLTVLEERRGVAEATPKTRYFELVFSATMPGPPQNLTIGTQLLKDGNSWKLIVHQKTYLGAKRLYLGLASELKLDDNKYSLRHSQVRIAHSATSILGSPIKHNPNLISCTYFAGITQQGQSVLLSYGVNDIKPGFASVLWSDLW